MTALTAAISRALIHFIWQGAVIALLFWVVLYMLRKKSPNARYVAACAALFLLAAAPAATTVFLYTSGGTAGTSFAAGAAGVVLEPEVPSFTSNVWLARAQSWTLPAWSLGVLLFSLRLMLGYRHAFVLRRRGKPAAEQILAAVDRLRRAMGVRRPIRLLISAVTDSPSVVGWIRPVILLPAATLIGLTPLQLEAILAHEIGHIKRYDYLVNVLQMVVETLLFYHPVVRWVSRVAREEREHCCDDLVVARSGDALSYARAVASSARARA